MINLNNTCVNDISDDETTKCVKKGCIYCCPENCKEYEKKGEVRWLN